jgi:succinate dehydrogenase/fumarate reductase flavoprotein subunit
MVVPFSWTEDGKIYQRAFGGQSQKFGKGGQDAVLLQTEPDTLYFTHFTVNRYDTTPIISSNTSLST